MTDRKRVSWAATALCATALLTPAPAVAQEAAEPALITVDFAGGSLIDYVRALHDAGNKASIVYPANASRVPVPQIALRQASVEAALMVLSDVVPEEFAVAMRRMQYPSSATACSTAVLTAASPPAK